MACAQYIESDVGRRKIVTSASRPTGASRYAGQTIYETDTGRELLYDGTDWVIMSEPWVSHTPVFAQGVALTVTTVASEYKRHDGICTWRGRVTATSAGTSGQPVLATLPLGGATEVGVSIGGGVVFDLSTAQRYVAAIEPGTTAATMGWGTDGTSAFWGSGPTLAVASGDIFTWLVQFKMLTRYT